MSAYYIPRSLPEMGGAINESQLPGTGNFYWDQAAKQHVISGQVTGVGGDRHNLRTASGVDLAKYDRNGTLHRYLGPTANPSGLYSCDHALQTDAMRPAIPFTFNSSSHLNMSGTTYNNVYGIGWNDNSGVPVVSGNYLFRDTWEDNYEVTPGVFQAERHVGSVIDPTTGQEIRPLTFVVVTSSRPFQAQVSTQTHLLKQVLTDGSMLTQSSQVGDDVNFLTKPFNAFQNVPAALTWLRLGHNLTDSILYLNGKTARFDFTIANVSKWAMIAHSDNNFYLNNASGNVLSVSQADAQVRFYGGVFSSPSGTLPTTIRLANATATGGQGDYSWKVGGPASGSDGDLLLYHGPTSKLLIRANGTGLGFFGSTAVAKPTVTGSWADGSAGASLAANLASLGLITNSTTA